MIYGQATLDGIASVCREHDLCLISDEVYDTQVWEGQHVSPRALPGMAERTLVVGSMSKSHAMTGSRCGWLVGPEEAIAHLINLATHTTYGVPGFIQDASVFALAQGPEFEAEIAAPFRRRRAIARRILAAQDTVGLIPSGGAMYLMLDIRATGLSGESFAEQLLEAHRIAVMPGESFGAAAAGHLRVAMTIADDDSGADVAGQTQQVLDLIESRLDEAGSDKHHILFTTIWLAEISDFDTMNGVWDAWVSADAPPARATVEAKLARPELRVEIAVVAAVSEVR